MIKKPAFLAFIFGFGLFFVVWLVISSWILPRTYPVINNQNEDFLLPTFAPTPTPACANLLFGGDLMFDRHIRQNAQAKDNYDYLLANLIPIFNQADAIIANLEGPVTDFPSRSVNSEVGSTNNYIFTFEPKILQTLNQYPFIFNLGNNHILNFGQEGLKQTYQYLEQNQLNYFGFVGQPSAKPSYLIKEINGLKLGLINYNQFITGGQDQALADLTTVRPMVDAVIVYAHWGNEYVPENQVTKSLAHEFIDAGADLLIGAHPHVVQGTETYQNKKIYYSLGNFVFDQYFEPAVQKGLLVQVKICHSPTLENLEFNFTDYPIVLKNTGETELAN